MDRNLGAPDVGYHSHDVKGGAGLYYQWGRKDPFPGSYTIYKYNYNQSNPDTSPSGNRNIGLIDSRLTGQGMMNVPFSVLNPVTFLYGNNVWTSGDIYNPTQGFSSIVWNDPIPLVRSDTEETDGKSFFDPCPPGWHVPPSSVYSNFITDFTNNASTNNPSVTYIAKGLGNGSVYFPRTFLYDKNSPERIVFPKTHRRVYSDGLFSSYGVAYQEPWYWTSSHRSTTDNSTATTITVGVSNNASNWYTTNGHAVRCVRK